MPDPLLDYLTWKQLKAYLIPRGMVYTYHGALSKIDVPHEGRSFYTLEEMDHWRCHEQEMVFKITDQKRGNIRAYEVFWFLPIDPEKYWFFFHVYRMEGNRRVFRISP